MNHAVKKCSARVSSRRFRTDVRIKLHADWGRLFATVKVIDRAAKGELSNQGLRIRNQANICQHKITESNADKFHIDSIKNINKYLCIYTRCKNNNLKSKIRIYY
jgi:hypothetical protein